MMSQQSSKPMITKAKTTDKARPLNVKTRHQSLPGAFADDELSWILTDQIGGGTPARKDESTACSVDPPNDEESPATTDEARTVQDQEGGKYDPAQGARCPCGCLHSCPHGYPHTEGLLPLEDLSDIESHMRQIGEMESGHSTVLGAGSKLRIYGEDQSCAVEGCCLVKDSPQLDHLERLRALEEATLR